jgi:hypothetical protein
VDLLLDTNVLIALVEEKLNSLPRRLHPAIETSAHNLRASVASL